MYESTKTEHPIAGPGPAAEDAPKPKLRVSAVVTSGFSGDKSYLKDHHARVQKELALAEREIANWDPEAVAAQALKALKADLVRLRGDLLGCEAELDEAEILYDGADGADGDGSDAEDGGDEADESDSGKSRESAGDDNPDESGDAADAAANEDNEDVIASGNPYSVINRNGKFVVENNETGKVKGSHATKTKALKQFHLLEAVEHGWEPTDNKMKE